MKKNLYKIIISFFLLLNIHVNLNKEINNDFQDEYYSNNDQKQNSNIKKNRCGGCSHCKSKKAAVGILGGGAIGAGIGAATATNAGTGALIGGPIGAVGGLLISQIL